MDLAITDIDVVFNTERRDGWELLGVDLNKGAGGDFVFITFFRDPAKQQDGQMITDVQAFVADPDRPAGWDGWLDVDGNLNRGSGGADIVLRYRRNAGDPPVTDVAVVDKQDVELGEGWVMEGLDLNKATDRKGATLYLCSKHRAPVA